MYGALESFSLMLMNTLGVPPGVTLRKYYGTDKNSSGDSSNSLLDNNDFINSIVGITASDVCLGNSPFYLQGADSLLSPELKDKYTGIVNSLNKVSRWIAIDILKKGVSAYTLHINKKTTYEYKDGIRLEVNRDVPRLVPVLDSLEFYMTKSGDVVVLGEDQKPVNDLLVFLSYSKTSLQKVDDKDLKDKYLYKITPEPVQLNNVSGVASDLDGIEKAMYRYRAQLSRIIRLVAVDVGVSQGDKNQEVIDDIHAAINANSMSLPQTTTGSNTNFDDTVAVLPTRKGIGRPEVISDIPDFSAIKDLADLDYTLNKEFLALSFPKTYADFSTNLNDTAVSLIRSDIRYTRMVDRAKALIQDTVNEWLFGEDVIEGLSVKLATIPTSEDDDVVDALMKYSDFVEQAFGFVSQADDENDANARLDCVVILLGDVANIKSIQDWVVRMKEYIADKFERQDFDEDLDDNPEVLGADSKGGFGAKDTQGQGDGDSLSLEVEPPAETASSGGAVAPPEEFDLPPMA